MYCPNCDKEYEGKFCPECGTKLIEKPATSAGVVNLGDANAISGGLHVNDSHNVHNEDKSVHNISNVSNVTHNVTQVAAQKTEMELLQEKKALYLNECKRAYEDNVLEHSEIVALEEYRIKIGLDKATADSILDSVRVMTERNARKTSLNPIAKIKLKLLTDNLQKNEVKALMDQIDSLEALVNKFEYDELSRKYFLVLAALKPEKCISLKENSKIDSYWKSFWSYLAYIKAGRTAEAENVLMSMDRFADYPEDNITILAIAGALINGSKEDAKAYLESITGDYTPALQRFVDSIYLLLEPDMAKEMGTDENTCAFYLVNFFGKWLTWNAEAVDSILSANWGRYMMFDLKGNLLSQNSYDDVSAFSEGLAKVKLSGKYGYIDKTGREVITCMYDGASDFREGIAWVEMSGKYGYIDKTGREVVPCKYDDATGFSDGLSRVKMSGKWGYIDKTGREVIPCKYDSANPFREGIAIVLMDGRTKTVCIDMAGRELAVITGAFLSVPGRDCWKLRNMMALPAGSFDKFGNYYNCDYEILCRDGLAPFQKDKKWGYIDKTGREVVPCIYDRTYSFREGLAMVEQSGKVGYIDKTGREVVPCIYDEAYSFSEGLAKVKQSGKWGYIVKVGRVVISCKYDGASDFSEGLAKVKQSGKWGYIDKTGREVVPCIYDDAYSFREELAKVELSGKWGCIGKTGREVLPCKFDSVSDDFREELARDKMTKVKQSGKWGYIDETGREVIPCEYDGIKYSEQIVFAKKD